MRRTGLIAVTAALPLAVVLMAWAAPAEPPANSAPPASPAMESVPVAKLSEAAQKIVAAWGPEWTLKESGRSDAPPGWTGETKCEYLTAVRKFPEQAVEERLEIWLCPAAYNGEVLPYTSGPPVMRPWLLAAGDERLLFVRLRYFDVGYAPVKVGLDAVTEKLGLKPATDRERTPAAVKADPRTAAEHKGWSEKTKQAVAKVESQIDSMELNILYTGPQPGANPYLTLNLNMWVVQPPRPEPPGMMLVYMPKWYRRQWLYSLADDGFFDRAIEAPLKWEGPKYSIVLGAHDFGWHEDLGWNTQTGKRLDALRKEMLGDAAKQMEALLKRLEPDRKEWEKAAVKPTTK
jgi:hypothetical protein